MKTLVFKNKTKTNFISKLDKIRLWIAKRNPKRFRKVLPRTFCCYGPVNVVDKAEHQFGGIWIVYSKHCVGCGQAAPTNMTQITKPNCAMLTAPMLVVSDDEIKPNTIIRT